MNSLLLYIILQKLYLLDLIYEVLQCLTTQKQLSGKVINPIIE